MPSLSLRVRANQEVARVGKYALHDFTVAGVSSLLEDIAREHTLNKYTFGKIRSILSGIFT